MKKEAFWEAHLFEKLQASTGASRTALQNLIISTAAMGNFSHSDALKILANPKELGNVKKLLNLLKVDEEQPAEMYDEGNTVLHNYTSITTHDREPAGIMPHTPLSIPAGTVA
jgi:hypothetical protein